MWIAQFAILCCCPGVPCTPALHRIMTKLTLAIGHLILSEITIAIKHPLYGIIQQKHTPHVAKKGEELIAILEKHGGGSPAQALASLVAIRQSLGLTNKQVIIIDGRSSEKI